jgi:hypothetical protein
MLIAAKNTDDQDGGDYQIDGMRFEPVTRTVTKVLQSPPEEAKSDSKRRPGPKSKTICKRVVVLKRKKTILDDLIPIKNDLKADHDQKIAEVNKVSEVNQEMMKESENDRVNTEVVTQPKKPIILPEEDEDDIVW